MDESDALVGMESTSAVPEAGSWTTLSVVSVIGPTGVSRTIVVSSRHKVHPWMSVGSLGYHLSSFIGPPS